jgi:hypothetical protein
MGIPPPVFFYEVEKIKTAFYLTHSLRSFEPTEFSENF